MDPLTITAGGVRSGLTGRFPFLPQVQGVPGNGILCLAKKKKKVAFQEKITQLRKLVINVMV